MDDRVSPHQINLSPAGLDLLRAAGVPASLVGAGRTVPIVQVCLEQAKRTWPDAPFNKWLLTMGEVNAELKRALETGIADPVSLFSAADTGNAVQHEVNRWPHSATTAHDGALLALLGRALVLHQHARSAPPGDFLSGLYTLRLARLGRGHRSNAWAGLVDMDLASIAVVQPLLEVTPPQSRTHPFLTALSVVLSTTVRAPSTTETPQVKGQDFPSAEKPEGPADAEDLLPLAGIEVTHTALNEQRHDGLGLPEPAADKSTSPRISARLAAADYTSIAEKLGLHDREHLLPEDLVSITTQLAPILQSEDPVRRGFATLAVLSLITCTSDHFTLSLRLRPVADGIWLNLEAGAWAWDYGSYLRSGSTPRHHDDIHPLQVPMPVTLHEVLVNAQKLAPGASTAGQLICTIQGVDRFDLKGFRAFLRSLGDSAHPPYLARFPRSFQSCVLAVTRSDMLAGLLTANFSMTAPAALFYFGPTNQVVCAQLDHVFHRLGLGPPTKLLPELSRAGCVAIPCEHESRTGWESLVKECNELRRQCLGASTRWDRVELGTRWMEHLCAAFILQVAHRGTRLELLTGQALLTDHELGVIHDKDDTTKRERQHARLMPWTPAVKQILAAAVECHAVIHQTSRGQAVLIQPDSPLFCKFSQATDRAGDSVSSQAIGLVIQRHFKGAPINVGRSIWVTGLDEASCDRWLIRALTGHTRDISRVGDALFDVSPCETAERLHDPMCKASEHWFGPSTVESATQPFSLAPTKKLQPVEDRVPGRPGVPDPRTLLHPIDAGVLSGWKLAHRLRLALLRGEVSASPGVLGLLHLTLLELIPEPEVGVQAIDASDSSAWYSSDPCHALHWTRPHFKHPVLLPIRASTWMLLQHGSSCSRHDLLAEVEAGIRSSELSDAFPIGCDVWQTLCSCAKAFRRLEMQPTLQAVSHPQVPAPCLNPQSIVRLTFPNKCSHDEITPRITAGGSTGRKSRGSDLAGMSTILNRLSDQDLRLGERRQRAILALQDVEKLPVEWSAGGVWLRDWILEELVRSRDNHIGSYQISSLATYLSTVLVDTRWTTWDDPQEWDHSDWDAFVELINVGCRSQQEQEEGDLVPRAKHALSALARSLLRRAQYVPYKALKRLAEPIDTIPPWDSASSVLILQEDYDQTLELLNTWLEEEPATLLLARTRAAICHGVPVRSGEVSSLPADCLTRNGALVIRRTGFNNLKTETSIRTVAVSDHLAYAVLAAREHMKMFVPAADLLMRGTGAGQDVDRDNKALDHWKAALKTATADPKARPHSLRAATLQEMTWPGWQGIAKKLTNGALTQTDAAQWLEFLQSDWHRLANATASAGQSGIQSAIGHYLAGWPFVHAAQTLALLPAEGLHPSLLRQLAISPNRYRQTKSRHAKNKGNEAVAAPFCNWNWLCTQAGQAAVPPKGEVKVPPPGARTPAKPRPTEVPDLAKLQFLCLTGLGVSAHEAHLSVGILWSQAARLEQQASLGEDRAACNRRSRAPPGGRGQRADVDLCLSTRGEEIMTWINGLRTELVEFLLLALLREKPADERIFEDRQCWQAVMQNMPSELCIVVRRGKAYVTSDEVARTLRDRTQFQLIPDPKLGRRPQVRLTLASKDNRVMSSRLTSVMRIAVLSLYRIRNQTSIYP